MLTNYNVTKWVGITLTEKAACQIQYLMQKYTDMLGLRINIKKSGCAGFSYIIEKVVQARPDDQIYEYNNSKLYISRSIMYLIDGMQLDYMQDGINQSFKFNNPKAQYSCGCGVSFGI